MVNVIGLGYIGLPTALMLASKGFDVVGTDIDEKKINLLNSGELTFNEKGLQELFFEAKKNDVQFSVDYHHAKIYIITVPTPFIKESKKVDSYFVVTAFKSILEVCQENSIVIIESTISPGFIFEHLHPLVDQSPFEINKNLHIVHAPERILPGNLISELINNSRTIGLENDNIRPILLKLYKSFCDAEVIFTDIKTAEMSKVVENTFRDINIAFANELAQICRKAELDVYEVIKIANMHPRVNILNPGPGVGGHCIPVDPWFLVGDFPNQTQLISTARHVNEKMIEYVMFRVAEVMTVNKIEKFSEVGIYGLSYKENVDDYRESPTIKFLEKYEYDFPVFDPHVTNIGLKNHCDNFESFLAKIKMIVIFVGHNHIVNHANLLENKVVLDFKNALKTTKKYTI